MVDMSENSSSVVNVPASADDDPDADEVAACMLAWCRGRERTLMSDVRAEGGSDTEEEVVGEPLREMEGNKGREEGDRSDVTPERRADRPIVRSGQRIGRRGGRCKRLRAGRCEVVKTGVW
jgi:hypothetical protein